MSWIRLSDSAEKHIQISLCKWQLEKATVLVDLTSRYAACSKTERKYLGKADWTSLTITVNMY